MYSASYYQKSKEGNYLSLSNNNNPNKLELIEISLEEIPEEIRTKIDDSKIRVFTSGDKDQVDKELGEIINSLYEELGFAEQFLSGNFLIDDAYLSSIGPRRIAKATFSLSPEKLVERANDWTNYVYDKFVSLYCQTSDVGFGDVIDLTLIISIIFDNVKIPEELLYPILLVIYRIMKKELVKKLCYCEECGSRSQTINVIEYRRYCSECIEDITDD